MEIRKFNLSQRKVIPALRPTLTAPNESFTKQAQILRSRRSKRARGKGTLYARGWRMKQ